MFLLPQHTFPIIPASIVLLSGELRLQLVLSVQSVQKIWHLLFLFFTGGGHRTARMASSNTVLRPRCVKAEHSRYFTAPVAETKENLKWIQTAKAGQSILNCGWARYNWKWRFWIEDIVNPAQTYTRVKASILILKCWPISLAMARPWG